MKRAIAWTAAILAVAFLAPHTVYGIRSGAMTPWLNDPQPGTPVAFKHERSVTVDAPGPNRLDVDVPLLAAGQPFRIVARQGDGARLAVGGLGDLRLYDEADREVPYLLVAPPDHRAEWWSTASLLEIAATKTSSGFEADLGRPQLVDRVALAGLPAPLLKRVRLEGSGERSRWSVLAPEATVFDLPDERLQQLEIAFPAGEFRYFRVTWDDRSSARVGQPRELLARAGTALPAPPPLVAEVPFERRTAEPGKTRYRLRLPGPQLPIVALEVDAGDGNILRHARVTESRLAQGRVEPVEIGSGILRQSMREGTAAREMRIPVEQPSRAELELTIENGNNPALDVAAVRAVFAELPWIYLEAPRAGTLTAKLGNERLTPPRYDLEAVRADLSGKQMAEARWGTLERGEAAAPAAGPALATAAGARVDPGAFRFSREIAESAPGLTAIRVDAAVLAHARAGAWGGAPGSTWTTGGGAAFADLRVIDSDGNQVPYLIEQLDEPLVVTLPALSPGDPSWAREVRPSSGAVSIYRLQLPFAGLPASRLLLQTPSRVFDRRLTVRDDPQTGRDRRGVVLGGGRWTHTDLETQAPSLTLPLTPSSSENAWLVVDEGDNSPLPIDQPTLLLPGYRLRFNRLSRAPLRLAYGDDELDAPQYDLSLLAPALLGAPATEVPVGPERVAPPRTPASRLVFWAALVTAVLVLLFLIARLVTTAGPPKTPEGQG